MNQSLTNRRDFLRAAMVGGLALAARPLLTGTARGIEPIPRKGPARFHTSLVGYSLRKYMIMQEPSRKGAKRFPNPPNPISMFDFVDYAAAQGFDAVELTSYFFDYPITDEYLIRLRRHVYTSGLAVSGTSVGAFFATATREEWKAQVAVLKEGIDHAVLLGAPYVRAFAGSYKNMLKPGAMDFCVEGFQECAEYAGKHGIFVGLENDGGVTPDMVLEIVHRVKSPWFALNLDLGNYHTDDVYRDVARCAPYAVNVHFKRSIQENGKPEVKADYARLLGILRDAGYQGYLAFEYEADTDPYEDIPKWKAEADPLIRAAAS